MFDFSAGPAHRTEAVLAIFCALVRREHAGPIYRSRIVTKGGLFLLAAYAGGRCKRVCYYILVEVKPTDLTLEQILSLPCPTCDAVIEEPCKLNTGALRTEPHRDRKLSAAEAVEKLKRTQ